MSTNNNGYYSTEESPTGEYDAMLRVVRQVLAGAHFCALARVVSVESGKVDVQPLVNMLDGEGNAIPHGVINDLPFLRLQGGGNAVIIDPQAGDIGLVVVTDIDSSSAIAARDTANPGSMRRNDLADGFYLGGLLNAAPTQYVKFNADGIEIYSPTRVLLRSPKIVKIQAPSIVAEADYVSLDSPLVKASGNVSVAGGATGNFSTPQGTVVTVKNGIVTNIF